MLNFKFFSNVAWYKIALLLYFKEIQVIGTENIPQDKPIIFILNHSNQFVDSYLIALKSPHSISYLTAAVSHKQGVVGLFSKIFESVSVERPWDNAVNGIGKIEPKQGGIVKGHLTKFTKQASVGDTLLIKGFLEYSIVEIKSDTEMKIKSKTKDTFEFNEMMDYKIASKLNQFSVFENALKALFDERWLVIFPEGCSHDRTDLLPLKLGVSIIGLEAMTKYRDLNLNFVCWGLKYSHPSRFRSKVTVEFGTPFKIDAELLKEYENNKMTTCNKFLGVIESKLREVTFTAPSYKELSSIYLAKRLYVPTPLNKNYDKEEINNIYKKMFGFYNLHKNKQDVKSLFTKIHSYGKQLKDLGIRDSQLLFINLNFIQHLFKILMSTLNIIVLAIWLFPGFIFMIPLGFYSKVKAEQVRILKKGICSVGAETVSSTRIITTFTKMPIFLIGCWTFAFVLQQLYTNSNITDSAINSFYFILFFLPYCYFWVITSDKIVKSFVNIKYCVYGLLYKNLMKKLKEY